MPSNEISPDRFQINFDPLSKKQLDEAKAIYIEAKSFNRAVYSHNMEILTSWKEVKDGFIVERRELPEDQFPLRILDESGDRRLVWDCRSSKETNEAAKKFEEYLAKGWKAYAINRHGKKNFRIMGFDSLYEEVIFEEKNTKEKLTDFCKKVSEVRMVPSTRPG